jgi:hypothetical protein
MDTLDMKLEKSLCYRGLEFADDILNHSSYLDEAYAAGRHLVEALLKNKKS